MTAELAPDLAPVKPPYRVPSMGEIRAVPWNGYTAASTFSGCGGSSLGYRMAGYRVAYANEFVEAARDTYAANASPHTVLDGRDIRAVTPQDVLDATGLTVGELDLLDGSPPCASFSTAGKRHRGWGKESAYSDTTQRSDDLFFEFIRLLTGIQPRVFVAENVSGLVKGTAKGYFREILAAMKAAGYVVAARLLDAQWLGVPQARQRLIFVGVRTDLGLNPAHPAPLPYRYTVRDALPHLAAVSTARGLRSVDEPAPTVQTHGRPGTQSELTIVAPDPDVDAGPSFAGRAIHAEWLHLAPGESSDRYMNLTRPHPDRPLPTVTATGGSHPGTAAVTHPTEPRKFSIPELRRLCGFPDDFTLTGTYSQQWERLGRAVPPPMMAAVAGTVRDRILARAS